MKIHTVELRTGEPELHEVVLHSEHLQLLAQVEAERDTALQQVLDVVERSSDDIVYLRGQLAEAVRLMREVEPHKVSEELETRFRAFISRHGQAAEVTWDYRGPDQAEQQEAESPMAKIAEGLRQKAAGEWASHPSNPARQEAQGAQAGEFQREDRYIVIKRKDLEKAPTLMAYALQVALDGLREHLPERQCLVIEGDWPEFEPTWAAIKARVEGRAAQAVVQDEVDRFFEQAKAELRRARAKFPGDRIMTLALAEEFGELCKAVLDESAEAVRKEAVQVACMAARVVLDGDGSVVDWRRKRGLDPLLAAVRGAEHE